MSFCKICIVHVEIGWKSFADFVPREFLFDLGKIFDINFSLQNLLFELSKNLILFYKNSNGKFFTKVNSTKFFLIKIKFKFYLFKILIVNE